MKFYGWYIQYGYNKHISFEQFLSPMVMTQFLVDRIQETVATT